MMTAPLTVAPLEFTRTRNGALIATPWPDYCLMIVPRRAGGFHFHGQLYPNFPAARDAANAHFAAMIAAVLRPVDHPATDERMAA